MTFVHRIVARRFASCSLIAAMSAALALGCARPAAAAEPFSKNYGQERDFLVKYTKVVEMVNEDGTARVAICPELQGRVMTSTCAGLEGPSFGWINHAFLEKGEKSPHFNNYGGEDRFWLGPEGGPFSLWFAPGAKQNMDNWLTPAALNDGPFTLAMDQNSPYYRLARQMKLQNAAKAQFSLDVNREIHLLAAHQFAKMFGEEAKGILATGGLKWVGYETVNVVTNRGAPMSKDKGLVSIWILGMYPPSPHTTIIVPYRDGDESTLGPVVKSDYFGEVPADRLKIAPEAILFRGDGKYRSKIGTSQRRGKSVAGSFDPETGILTLVHFSLPDDPTAYSYVNNSWGDQKESFVGDVCNSYNDGPTEPGKPSLGGFYELESVSPAAQLPTGKSLSHTHSTFHIQGDPATLAKLARLVLGVDLSKK